MYNGILVFNKPQEFTSHDVVAKLRGILRQKKIGHAGTLDPMATGVLLVLLGTATRASDFAGDDKTYIAKIKLGLTTDTQDIWGNMVHQCSPDEKSQGLEAALPAFRGEIMQRPPMYSAVKVDGRRLYSLARKGHDVDRPARPITVSTLELLSANEIENEYELLITCSKGTYIRALCHDIGQSLGCGACMSGLVRTQSGNFNICQSIGFEETEFLHKSGVLSDLIYPVDMVFNGLPALHLNSKGSQKALCGAFLDYDDIACGDIPSDGLCRVYDADGNFYMTGSPRQTEDGTVISCHKTFAVSK